MDEVESGRLSSSTCSSFISTRAEMRPLFNRLAPEFRVTTTGRGSAILPGRARRLVAGSPVDLPQLVETRSYRRPMRSSLLAMQPPLMPFTKPPIILDDPPSRSRRADLARTIADNDGGRRAWFARVRQAIDLTG